MKTYLFVCAALVAAPLAFGEAPAATQPTTASQATPEGFLAMVPTIPAVTNIGTSMARSAFHDKVQSVIDNMDAILKHMPDGDGAKKPSLFSKMVPSAFKRAADHAPDPTDAIKNTPTRQNLAKAKAKFAELDAEYKSSREDISVSETKSVHKANRMDSKTATKRYAALLKDYLAAVRAALPDFQKDAALSMANSTPGASKAAAISGPAMREVREYAGRLLEMYKYTSDND